MRRPLLAGNWKMNKSRFEIEDFLSSFVDSLGGAQPESIDILFAVPFTLLTEMQRRCEPYAFAVAAQNVHSEPSGAYTGEISLNMLKEINIHSTLIGHSERRQYFAETDESVAKKTRAAIAASVHPIVCVGESLAEREAGKTEAVVARQCEIVFDAVDNIAHLTLAYEPVWAIGTGRSATAEQAQQVHAHLRELLRQREPSAAETVRILYGGSANPANISDLLSQPDIDGGLVGGASLKPQDFAAMVVAAAAS